MSGFVMVKTQDLSGAALDLALTKAEGLTSASYKYRRHRVRYDVEGLHHFVERRVLFRWRLIARCESFRDCIWLVNRFEGIE